MSPIERSQRMARCRCVATWPESGRRRVEVLLGTLPQCQANRPFGKILGVDALQDTLGHPCPFNPLERHRLA